MPLLLHPELGGDGALGLMHLESGPGVSVEESTAPSPQHSHHLAREADVGLDGDPPCDGSRWEGTQAVGEWVRESFGGP